MNNPEKRISVFSIKILVSIFILLVCNLIYSQDIEPRLLSPIPIKSNFVVASYIYSEGNILLDNTSPIEDLDSKLNNLAVGYARSFKLFNKLALFDAIIP